MCDTLVSLTDHGVLFAKNSDREANEPQYITWHPAADHVAGARLRTTWIEIDQVPRTNAVVLSRPWWMWGAEIGANEHGVVIGNEAVYTTEPHGDAALLGMDLVRLALERADDADGAVEVIVAALERYGQGGACSATRPGFTYHNAFLVADRDGAIVLETAGRHWAVERVTGRGRSISNGLTIPGFAERFADREQDERVRCALRRTRTSAGAAAARTPLELFATLRDHGDGSPRWSERHGLLDGPCAHAGGDTVGMQTTSSWVADLRARPRHWVTATAAPCTSVFKPIDVDAPAPFDDPLAATSAPAPDALPTYDPTRLWWRHERFHRRVMQAPPDALAAIAAERDELERAWVEDPPEPAAAVAAAERRRDDWERATATVAEHDDRPAAVAARWARLSAAVGLGDLAEPAPHAAAERAQPRAS